MANRTNIVRPKRDYRPRVGKNKEHRKNMEKAKEAEELFASSKPRVVGYQHRQRSEITLPWISIQHREEKEKEL